MKMSMLNYSNENYRCPHARFKDSSEFFHYHLLFRHLLNYLMLSNHRSLVLLTHPLSWITKLLKSPLYQLFWCPFGMAEILFGYLTTAWLYMGAPWGHPRIVCQDNTPRNCCSMPLCNAEAQKSWNFTVFLLSVTEV